MSNIELAALAQRSGRSLLAKTIGGVKAAIRLQTTEEAAFAMATEGRGVPAATPVVERVTEEEETVAQETQQQRWAGDKLAAVRIRTHTRIRTRTPPISLSAKPKQAMCTHGMPPAQCTHTHACLPVASGALGGGAVPSHS
tara:strand:- start:1564 stop:1986 length:423 start_codon:yes stop_codon:yes gene_type:complete